MTCWPATSKPSTAATKKGSTMPPSETALLINILRTDFESFCRRAYETLKPGDRLSNDPYVPVVLSEVAKVETGEVKRLIVNLPQRHGKTLISSVFLAAWHLGRHPSHSVLIISYGEDLAREIAQQVRRILRSSWYIAAFGSLIAKDADRAAHFATTSGGGLLATSFGGNYVGFGAELIIVDDPSKIDDASSPEKLARVNHDFDTGVRSRLNNPREGRIVVVAHRLAANDLSGHLLQQGGWAHLKLPFRAEGPAEYPFTGGVWRREPGKLLRPDAFSEEEVQRIMSLTGSPDFHSLWQQSPIAEDLKLNCDDFPKFSTLPYMAWGGSQHRHGSRDSAAEQLFRGPAMAERWIRTTLPTRPVVGSGLPS
jgi:hypothetical protein